MAQQAWVQLLELSLHKEWQISTKEHNTERLLKMNMLSAGYWNHFAEYFNLEALSSKTPAVVFTVIQGY